MKSANIIYLLMLRLVTEIMDGYVLTIPEIITKFIYLLYSIVT